MMSRRADPAAVKAARLAGRQAAAAALYAVSGPVIVELRRAGMAFHDIAEELHSRGVSTPAGGPWWPGTVHKVWTKFKDRVPE